MREFGCQKSNELKIGETEKAQVSIGKDTGGGFALTVALDVKIPGVEQEVAEQLVESAHQICPYSKQPRDNMQSNLKAKGVKDNDIKRKIKK
ncbi:hypothetical protein [Lentibacillus sp. CBA3610]|uniref:hypothetical protein n=1 Tax=Lentibacillus sp. CBA3610 TaxID=2518176 RepID=UPI0020D25835|nr:hypothetical protein [Lentibacillus sp. CBA3610]